MPRFAITWMKHRCARSLFRIALTAFSGLCAAKSALAVGLTYVDADPSFFPNVAPSSAIVFTAGNTDGVWGRRTPFGAVDGGSTQAIYESGITENSPMLTQTVSGLTAGGSYDMYVVYWSNPNSPQDWRVQAGVAPEQLTSFNRLGPTGNLANATAGSFASAGVWDVAPMNAGSPIFSGTNLRMYVGKAGTVVADGSGQAQVYVDDVPNQGANFRTWFDGVAYAPAGTPVFLTATVNRDTGAISIANQTTQNFTVKSYSIASASGSLDATVWTPITGTRDGAGNGSFDSNPWAVTAPVSPASTPFATALTEGATTGVGGLLAAGGSAIQLGPAWQQTPYQDLVVTLTLSDNSTVTITPQYDGAPITAGDLDGNGTVAVADFQTLMTNLHTDVSTLAMAERYTRGDVTRNGVIDYYDFNKFAQTFDDQFGPGSFAAMAATVPECSSILLIAIGGIGLLCARHTLRNNAKGALVAMAIAVLAWPTVSMAAPVTGWALDPTFGGGLSGAAILTNAETNSPVVGDGIVTNNASNAGLYASIPQINLSPGQQIVLSGTMTINGVNNTLAGELRFGLFQENANPPATLGWLGFMARSSAGEDTGAVISRNPLGTNFATVTSFSDLAGRATVLANGGNSNLLASGDYNFQLTLGRFDDNSITAHASLVSNNGFDMRVYRGTEIDPARVTFDFNRAGFLLGSALNSNQIMFGNLDASVQSIVAPKLQISSNGAVKIVNTSGAPLDLKYYEIKSPSGALNLGSWISIDSTEGGDLYGTGWDVAGGNSASILSEGRLLGATTMSTGGTISLGNAAQAGGAHDLQFYYGLPDGSTYRGLVEYATAVPGDFDSDGDVDGADFVAWQTNFPKQTGATLAQGDADADGDVDGADFVVWQTNFPLTPGPGAVPVPEPAGFAIVLMSLGLVGGLRLRRGWAHGAN
jgi:hypothetical protein